jgi:mannitol-1-phosphate 5-dehydrogenase
MNARNAIVFGAGKMACGLIGHVLSSAGFTVQFVARRAEVVDAINRFEGFQLSIAGQRQSLVIRGCSALPIDDDRRVTSAVANADVVFTAVGIDNLAAVTPAIAAGLFLRSKTRGDDPLNVIACENLPGTGAYLQHQVLGAASPETALCVERAGGFSAAVTRRVMTGGSMVGGELHFSVDSEHGLIVDRTGLRGDLPTLDGMLLTDDFTALVMRKFFTVNCAQAVAAYLGYREGCQYIHEAVNHPRVRPVVTAALAEAAAALEAEFPTQKAGIRRDAAEALERLSSGDTADTISRVAREPRRKLSPRERLVGPARLAQRHELRNEALSRAIAAALSYDAPNDAQAVSLQQTIANESLEKVLTEDCGLLPHESLARAVKGHWRVLMAEDAQQGAAAPSGLHRSGAVLQDVILTMVSDLSRQYDPTLVRDALARVVQEHCAPYVPVFATSELGRRAPAAAA